MAIPMVLGGAQSALPGILGEIGAGPLFSGFTSLFGGAARNVSQEQQAAQQMRFQERMSSTAYQRAMQDMREAGLNPMLAAKVGPASSPVGAMANIQDIGTPAAQAATSAYQASTQRIVGEAAEQLSTAQAKLADKTADKIVAETSNVRNQAEVIVQTGLHLKELIKKVGQEARTSQQQENVLKKQVLLIAEQIKDTKAAAELKNADVAFIKSLEKQFGAGGNQVTQLLGMLIRLIK